MKRPLCDVCGRPVAAGRGVLAVDTRRAWEAVGAREAVDARLHAAYGSGGLVVIPLDAFAAYPDPVHWEWGHARCVRGDYAIDEERIDTPAKALGWTLHLMKKAWFEATGWETSVRRLGLVEEA